MKRTLSAVAYCDSVALAETRCARLACSTDADMFCRPISAFPAVFASNQPMKSKKSGLKNDEIGRTICFSTALCSQRVPTI